MQELLLYLAAWLCIDLHDLVYVRKVTDSTGLHRTAQDCTSQQTSTQSCIDCCHPYVDGFEQYRFQVFMIQQRP